MLFRLWSTSRSFGKGLELGVGGFLVLKYTVTDQKMENVVG